MHSTLDSIIARSKKSIKYINDYIVGGNLQKQFITDLEDVNIEPGTHLDSAISANEAGETNTEIFELQQAYSLKRDLHYAYAERLYLLRKGYDKRLGDHFRPGRDITHMEKYKS